MKPKAIRAFACPDCSVVVPINAMVLTEDNRIILSGTCPKCKAHIGVDVQDAISALFPSNGSGKGN